MKSDSNTGPASLFLLRYGIVGVTGGIIQTGTLYIWVEVLRMEAHYLVGVVIGFLTALLVTFTLQKYWTFRDHAYSRTRRQFVVYTVIALLNAGLNILLLHSSKLFLERIGVDFFDTWYLLAQASIVVALALASFLANYFITFRAQRPLAEGD
ncbi:MAG: hypothetical protein G01um101449_420 [Parcubacteria group bacterium Gr01-1014_49]|nr:MAG: hypothetical protein G01um101449_420 [Parcubacteria group bacterium Gr01-1014_49]